MINDKLVERVIETKFYKIYIKDIVLGININGGDFKNFVYINL